jgi:hypothetical protein
MAYVLPDKPKAWGRTFLESQIRRYEELVFQAPRIVMVGFSFQEHDGQVWNPIAKAKPELVYCNRSGPSAALVDWGARNDVAIKPMQGSFEGSVDEISALLCV